MTTSNPWSLLDVRDLHDAPRTQRQKALDDAIAELCTLRDANMDPDHPILHDLWADETLDGAITVLKRMRSHTF